MLVRFGTRPSLRLLDGLRMSGRAEILEQRFPPFETPHLRAEALLFLCHFLFLLFITS